MKQVLILLLFFITIKSFSNDGIVNSSGSNLICVRETKIELRKEVLTFTQNGSDMSVDIYFEFFNPDSTRNEIVGFITPPELNPEKDENTSQPNIKNFTVIVNDEFLDFNVSRIEDTEFNLILEKAHKTTFVYYFDVKFEKGINVIKHSYSFSPSFVTGGIYGEFSYNYRLTTGKNWANSVIEDFELNVRMKGLFTVPLYLQDGRQHNWELSGVGKISETDEVNKYNRKLLYVNIVDGYLNYKCKDLRPDNDIVIQLYNPLDYVDPLNTIFWLTRDKWTIERNRETLNKLTSDDYRIARNTLFAIKGYKFIDDELYNYFSKYFWYIPNDNIENDIEILSIREKSLFDKIVELEKESKTKENN